MAPLPGAGPLLDALGESYAAGCEGSAFYALQSCLNHSCRPNARAFTRDGRDTNGAAVILAKRAIAAGEEVGGLLQAPQFPLQISTPCTDIILHAAWFTSCITHSAWCMVLLWLVGSSGAGGQQGQKGTRGGSGATSSRHAARLLRQEAMCAQVCVSYIDESQDYNARQAALRDYGFTCACGKCAAESAAAGKGKALA